MVETLRTYSQQLAEPVFDDACDLVAYMGAVQAQDMSMSKWALGLRLCRPSLAAVQEAVDSGRIVRTHILRPTWHYVAASDVRWMLGLSGRRIRAAFLSYGKQMALDERYISRFYDAIGALLTGSDGLTTQEIIEGVSAAGVACDADRARLMLGLAEADGIVCNGRERDRKYTFALLDERVPAVPGLSKEEALALLARKYFQSHSPASEDDFVWWSGLPATEAKQAVRSIGNELISDRYEGERLFVHESCIPANGAAGVVHLLPPYDEYLISYKDRTHVLDPKHSAKAHNNFGIFQPVVFQDGKIVGNWKKKAKKGGVEIETVPFCTKNRICVRKLKAAVDRYRGFLEG